MSILDDLLVLDLSESRCGRYAALQLSNYGARVARLSTAAPDAFRRVSCRFAPEDLPGLLEKADVLLADRGTLPQAAEPEALRGRCPRLVIACVREEARGGGALAEAASGMMDMTGFPGGAPTLSGARVSECFAGVSLAFAITAALHNAAEHGEGAFIDFSLYDAFYSLLESPILFRELQEVCPTRCGSADPATLVPYDVFRCADGYFSAGLASDAGWDRFCTVLGMPELIHAPQYDTNEKRCGRYGEITALFAPFFAAHTRAELQERFSAANIPNAPVLSVHEAMAHPQLLARDMVRIGRDGRARPGTPIKMSVSQPVLDGE